MRKYAKEYGKQIKYFHAFLSFIILELSNIKKLHSLQRHDKFNAGGELKLAVFSSTDPIVENNPGFFSFLPRHIIPRPAIEYPCSIIFRQFGHFISVHTIRFSCSFITLFFLAILRTRTISNARPIRVISIGIMKYVNLSMGCCRSVEALMIRTRVQVFSIPVVAITTDNYDLKHHFDSNLELDSTYIVPAKYFFRSVSGNFSIA